MTESLHQDLASLGLDSTNYRALLMLPAIYVAWADRQLTPTERARVQSIARDGLSLSESERAVVERWLQRPPTVAEYQQCFTVLVRLAVAPDEPLFGAEDLPRLLTFAERVATRAAQELGEPFEIGDAERRALADLEAIFETSAGRPWADVVEEVGVDVNMVRHSLLPPEARPARTPATDELEAAQLRRYRAAVRASRIEREAAEPSGGLI